ncbi:MAG TPA: helix-turn-helix transcriptional regulator [Candidatus Saccharimonadales bacterium]|nr:helix-turn-helix transcriptional regulator [Candidatus Saccharimonadales bacterium]
MSESETPYITLGSHLRYIREQSRQSLSEVSGAVEIDEKRLEHIEAGRERPSEDILLLLISHFGVQDREAVQIWELAKYDSDMPDSISDRQNGDSADGPVVILMMSDVRTVYSDGVHVAINPAGVTLNFTQTVNRSQHVPVARVGMSHHQAEQVIRTLQGAMLRAKYLSETKLLPPSV